MSQVRLSIVENREKLILRLDKIGLFLLGFFSLCYSLFYRRFAEIHIQLPLLDFPIFIGEVLLFICLCILIGKWVIDKKESHLRLKPLSTFFKNNQFYLVALLFISFILIKALYGYSKYGPLALRHSAMFYYTFFAICGFSFYRRYFFKQNTILFLCFLLILIRLISWSPLVKTPILHDLFPFVSIILIFILIKSYRGSNLIRYPIFFIVFIFALFKLSHFGARQQMVGDFLTMVFIVIAFFLILKIKLKYKIAIFVVISLSLGWGAFKMSNEVKSVIDLKTFMKQYQEVNNFILSKEKDFKMEKIKPILYNKEVDTAFYKPEAKKDKVSAQEQDIITQKMDELRFNINVADQTIREFQTKRAKAKPENIEELPAVKEASLEQPTKPRPQLEALEREVSVVLTRLETIEMQVKQNRQDYKELENAKKKIEGSLIELSELIREGPEKENIVRSAVSARTTSFFRILIWRDMIERLITERAIVGINFGDPLRSKSIEIMVLAEGEWSRDGWITPHNSFINFIYRAGLIGIIYILFIFIIFIRMVVRSISLRSVNGILLCAAIMHILIIANFTVVLEIPHHAIPFWSLFGMVYAYLNNLGKKYNNNNALTNG